MKNGIRLFEKFDELYMEVCVPDKDRDRFESSYGAKTGENPLKVDGYNTRKRKTSYNAWGIEYRIYFKTSTDWLIGDLAKLGFHTEQSDKLIAVEFNKEHPENSYKCRVTDQKLFWLLVDYGYRLGENESISFDYYLLRKHLQTIDIEPLFEINEIESENPVYEAMLLVA